MNAENKLLIFVVFIGFLTLSYSIFYHAQHNKFEITAGNGGLYRLDKSTGKVDECFSKQSSANSNIHVEFFCDGWLAH